MNAITRVRKMFRVLPHLAIQTPFSGFGTQTKEEFERAYQSAIHERINRKITWYGKGRKWSNDYQRGLVQDARQIDERLKRRVRFYQLRTPELNKRENISNLLSSYND